MVNHVYRLNHERSVRLFLARVHISIETREIATRYLEAKFVARKEHIARCQQIQRNVINLPGFRKFWVLLGLSISKPQYSSSVLQTVGQTSTSIPVKSVSTAELLHTDPAISAGNSVAFEKAAWCRSTRHRRARRPMVLRTNTGAERAAAERAAGRLHRLTRIVDILIGFLGCRRNDAQ